MKTREFTESSQSDTSKAGGEAGGEFGGFAVRLTVNNCQPTRTPFCRHKSNVISKPNKRQINLVNKVSEGEGLSEATDWRPSAVHKDAIGS